MRNVALLAVVGLVIGACGGGGEGGVAEPIDTPQLMAVALEELVTKDHTFGEGPSPFTEFLVQAAIDPSAGDASESSGSENRTLSGEERSAIEQALGQHGQVQWIEDFDEWITDDLTPVVEGSAILGVGEPVVDDEGALVPVSLWCGGLCGTWFTYRLEMIDGVWVVTGKEGPIAIS